MPRELHDHWFKEAKREGWRSRAIYKLMAIDQKRCILSPGDAVLDCGCSPGSWLQYVATRIGTGGVAAGVDLLPLPPLPDVNIRTIEADLREIEDADLLALVDLPPDGAFDVILSDMAPNTTGHHDTDHLRSIDLCDMVLHRCQDLLKEGGHLVMKVFEGGTYPDLVLRTGNCFEEVRPMRPPASRNMSREIYIVARNRKSAVKLDPPAPGAGGPPPIPDSWGR